MAAVTVAPGGPLRGTVRVPGDKSISHRVLMLAALADGESVITGLSDGDDVARTRAIVEALGAVVVEDGDALRITGGALRAADTVLDVGNSGTGIRLLAGLLAGLPFTSILDGDQSIRRRPMGRIIDPLRAMGAVIGGDGDGDLAPITMHGGGLQGIEYELPVASAQVKSAVLLAGLSAFSPTTVVEPEPTRAHTEELLVKAGVRVDTDGARITVHPGRPDPFTHRVEGDPSQAAFWAVAAAIVPGSEVTVEHVYRGPARTGFVDVLTRMGADIGHDPATGDLTARASALTATEVAAAEVPGLVDEVPVLAVAAACAEGTTVFHGVAELRVKESDRLATVERELGRMGARVTATRDTLTVTGGPLTGMAVESHHDHRIAMSAVVAALVADGPTTVAGWDAVATSYPGFLDDLDALRGDGRG